MEKTRLLSTTIFITFIVTLTACKGSDDNNVVTVPIQSTLTETIDSYLAANLNSNEAGLSILVRKDGVAIYNKSKGLANKQTAIPLTHETGFRLASISKLFTALAIMQLYEQEQLFLSDSIGLYLPELPDTWHAITIHHLLSHQSGIFDYANDFSGNEQQWLRGMTNQELIEYYTMNQTLEFTPGTQADYSNSGYVLLAQIISRISGLSFAQYMQANIFQPTGMMNSYVIDENNPLKQGAALNFAQSEVPFNFELYLNGSMAQVSSVDDMNLFIDALQNGAIISQETFELMTQAHSNIPQANRTFGYAWLLGSGNVTSYDINGSNDSFQNLIIFVPVIDLQVVILTNGGESTNTHKKNIFRLINDFYNQQ